MDTLCVTESTSRRLLIRDCYISAAIDSRAAIGYSLHLHSIHGQELFDFVQQQSLRLLGSRVSGQIFLEFHPPFVRRPFALVPSRIGTISGPH
jgi:hypothetical protein